MSHNSVDPLRVPGDMWERVEVRDALGRRDVGALFRLVQRYVGASQTQIGIATGLAQGTVSRIMNGSRLVNTFDVIERVAVGLGMPDDARIMLGLAPTRGKPSSAPAAPEPDVRPTSSDKDEDVNRRAFVGGTLGAAMMPAIRLDDLNRLVAAMNDVRRYFDASVVDYLRQRLAACGDEDRLRGPKETLPVVLGIIGAIDRNVRDVKVPVRRELLSVGARAAEFAGWLYRDIGVPELADYWHDRAMEWAQACGDTAMQGYLLVKKSQSAWDARDAVRMLTLAQAAQEGPWQLPANLRAEAAQQEARGYAMLKAPFDQVERKVDDARRLFAEGTPTDLGSHYAAPLFAVQTAICYREAGHPEQAIEIYDRHLRQPTFSRRDYGYFLTLKSAAYVDLRAPSQATTTASQALMLGTHTNSARTIRELDRLVARLEPWANHPAVIELRRRLPSV
jgi:transcriptional regulator with XRE-family HTH domain